MEYTLQPVLCDAEINACAKVPSFRDFVNEQLQRFMNGDRGDSDSDNVGIYCVPEHIRWAISDFLVGKAAVKITRRTDGLFISF